MKQCLIFLISVFLVKNSFSQIQYPGKDPGTAKAKIRKRVVMLHNKSLSMQWNLSGNKISLAGFADAASGKMIKPGDLPFFELILKGGQKVSSEDFKHNGHPEIQNVNGSSDRVSGSGRHGSKCVKADLLNNQLGMIIHWHAILKDGSNYVQQVFSFESLKDSLQVDTIKLINLPDPNNFKTVGIVDGSPLVDDNMFFAIEHPMGQIGKTPSSAYFFLPRQSAILKANPLILSTVFGVTPHNQLRRGFLYYVERERAVPYHQFLHYNSWYDLSWIDRKLNEKLCLDRIQCFADSLIKKRGIPMDAFMFDDGWDDNKTLWQFNSGFPNGFTKLAEKAGKYKSHLGVWISPWGGYMDDQKQRLEFGRKQNPPYETNANGFSLTGPVYYKLFRNVAANFATKYDVSIFKFDGVGAGNGATGAGIKYQKDIEALLKLVSDLRAIKPGLFFNLTVGTWPSVYWLKYGDAIWRAGKDTDMKGVGSNRQKWITYHDAEVYKNVVQRAPLYPLNSLMYHGICIAENGPPAKFNINDKDIEDEIWTYFGNGTNLQELFINPHLLNTKNWDCLAKAIKWARENQQVLADVHWTGGDPGREEVYGFAAWSPKKAVLTLRNPSAQVKSFTINTADIFQLPVHATPNFSIYDARSADHKLIGKGSNIEISLAPFEVKVMDAFPE